MTNLDEIILKYRNKAQNIKNGLLDNICSTLAQNDSITNIVLDELDIEALRKSEEYEAIAEWLEEIKAFRKAK